MQAAQQQQQQQRKEKQYAAAERAVSSSKHQQWGYVRFILRSSTFAVKQRRHNNVMIALYLRRILSARKRAGVAKTRGVAARVHALATAGGVAAAAAAAAASSISASISAGSSACLRRLSSLQQQRSLAAALMFPGAPAQRSVRLPQRLQQQHRSKHHAYLLTAGAYYMQ